MDDTAFEVSTLLRLVGFACIGIGVAWALQILDLSASAGYVRFLWILSAAAISGVGSGLLLIARSEPDDGSIGATRAA